MKKNRFLVFQKTRQKINKKNIKKLVVELWTKKEKGKEKEEKRIGKEKEEKRIEKEKRDVPETESQRRHQLPPEWDGGARLNLPWNLWGMGFSKLRLGFFFKFLLYSHFSLNDISILSSTGFLDLHSQRPMEAHVSFLGM